MKILNPHQAYTFSNIFALKAEIDDIAKDFGYAFSRTKLNLPKFAGQLNDVSQIQQKIEALLPLVSLTTEMARREILISEVVTGVALQIHAQIRIEYPLKVSDQLQGNLDYLLQKDQKIVVIEAKNEDFVNGMKQLIVEMIALDQWENTSGEQTHLIGGITTGKIWEFARLDRARKHIEQGLESYRVPEDLEPLMRILIQALTGHVT